MRDFSFIKLYKNDFALAKRKDNPNIATILYSGFILQKPDETFLQISNSEEDIAFIGAINTELIDSCGEVLADMNDNFYYENFTGSNGVEQIAFEFGNVNKDFGAREVFLKITDVLNDNIWYSNGFMLTNLDVFTALSTRFDYTNRTKVNGISYDVAPYIQSVRFTRCYDNATANKREVKQYITSQGKQTNYRNITTYLRKYIFDSIDYFINDRLEVLFSSGKVYINGQKVVVSDFKVNERQGDTNKFSAEFIANEQGEKLIYQEQLYPALKVLERLPIHESIFSIAQQPTTNGVCTLTFNKNISIVSDSKAKLYKDGVLIQTVTITASNNIVSCPFTTSFASLANGEYFITIPSGAILSGTETFEGFVADAWKFTVAGGAYDSASYNNEYLIN
jgi:hypothetical protein